MKKLLFLIIPLMIVGLIACEDHYFDPPVTPTHTYKASARIGGTIKPLSGEAAIGATIPFTVTEHLGYKVDSFTVNGVITKLTDLGYKLKVGDSDYDLNVTFQKTLSWYPMQVTWKLDSTYIHEQNGTWSYYKTWGVPGTLQKTIKFLPNGYTAVTVNGDNTLSDGFWRIDESKTPPEIHFAGDAAALGGSVFVLEGDLKTRLVLAGYNFPFIEDFTKKGDFKYIYTPLK